MIRLLTLELPDNSRPEYDQMPHVLLVVDQFSKSLGGGERVVLKLAALLPRYGFRVSILTFYVHPESAALKSATCPVYELALQRTYDFTALLAAFELRRFLKQHKIRIVHTFFESSDLWAGFITKTTSAKLIWARRDMGILRERKHSIAYRFMANFPDAVFAVSEQVRQHCIDVDHIDPARVQTIYNGLDLADWEAAVKPRKPSGEFLIATVGNIRRVKGHDVFIKAAAVIANRFPEVRFSIAGEVLEPKYFDELETLVRDFNLSDKFRFEGGVTELREYLSKADIFILPSHSEGFSNSIIEAMAAALPVVATNVGGNAEAVEDGASGLIVPADDSSALASAIVRLLSDPSLAKAMGVAGRSIVTQRFTIDAMMSHTVETYKKLIDRK